MIFAYLFQIILLVSLSFSAPHKKNFNEHFEDFLGHILAETGDEFENILANYSEKEEFWAALTYFSTTEFRNIFHEFVSLQEFRAVSTSMFSLFNFSCYVRNEPLFLGSYILLFHRKETI